MHQEYQRDNRLNESRYVEGGENWETVCGVWLDWDEGQSDEY